MSSKNQARELYKQREREQRVAAQSYHPGDGVALRQDPPSYRAYDDDIDTDRDQFYSDRNRRRSSNNYNNGSGTLKLNELFIDWMFCKDDTGQPIYLPIPSGLFFSDQMGGLSNIKPYREWQQMGLTLRQDAVWYKGQRLWFNSRQHRELVNVLDSARNEIIAALRLANDPPVKVMKVNHTPFLIWLILLLETFALIYIGFNLAFSH